MKKIMCIFLTALVCSFNICFPVSSNAAVQTSDVMENKQSDHMLFSKMFFEKKDDIDKITQHFNSEISSGKLPELEGININDLIRTLRLGTNYEETNCIVKNIISIDEYVDEEQINNATTGSSISDPNGGMLSKYYENISDIQPLWDKDTFHNNATANIAKDYFSSSVASKIGKYNREVDKKYSSGFGAITGSANQYIHFNQYASGSEDSRDYAAATWFIACELAWNKGQTENAYMYLGYALNPLQDKEAHGQIGRGKKTPQHLISYTKGDNITHADDETGWEWTNSNRNALKKVSGSRKRYNAAVSVTRTYLSQYKKILK